MTLRVYMFRVLHAGVNQNYLVNTSSYLAALHGVCQVYVVSIQPALHHFLSLLHRLKACWKDTTAIQQKQLSKSPNS